MSLRTPRKAPTAPQPAWDHLRAFLAVVRTGSLSAAARALGVAQPTVRRQIAALERELGASLFTRSPAGLVPTERARATLPYAEAIAGATDALVRALSADAADAQGTVRVTCSEVVGVEVLPPVLADLRRSHPGVQIELVATNRTEDLLRRDADVAVRMARPTQAALLARRAGSIELGLFASEDYLREHPAPRTPAELARDHALIGRDRDDRAALEALSRAGLALRRQHFALRTDSDVAQLAAIRAGFGVGVCHVGLSAGPPALRRVLPGLRFALEAWVVTHEDLRGARRVMLVFEHLVTALARYARHGRAAGPPRL